MSATKLLDLLKSAIMSAIQPQTRDKIPALLDALNVPESVDDPELSKRKYVQSRLDLIEKHHALSVAGEFVTIHWKKLTPATRFEIQELIWLSQPAVIVPKRLRFAVARALEPHPLFLKSQAFLDLVDTLWDKSSSWIFPSESSPLREDVERHLVRNPEDWTVEQFFEKIGAFECSDRRFGHFLEELSGSNIRPEETSQREFVAAVNSALNEVGVELREVDQDGGFPVFRLASRGAAMGRPKNIIFASQRKPDIRLRDAVTNDIEIVGNAGQVLVYDRPISPNGLRWRDLQEWWSEERGIVSDQAKKDLYKRLRSSLPTNSPPQLFLFEQYFRIYRDQIPDLPALLPEVWLFWDPKAVRDRGFAALTRHRMDFLLLLPNSQRVVLEVDGSHHYANSNGFAEPVIYARLAEGDRDLRLSGYEVYRFGATELGQSSGAKVLQEFFDRLFQKHRIL